MSTNQTITWEAHEYRHYEKSLGWYVAVISIILLICTFFVIVQNDIFGAASIGIMGIIVLLFSRRAPEVISIELNSKGISFSGLHIPYKQIKYFWMVTNKNHNSLNFVTTTLLNNLIVLELNGQDPEEIRLFLLQYLPEHEEVAETPAQRFAHWIKF